MAAASTSSSGKGDDLLLAVTEALAARRRRQGASTSSAPAATNPRGNNNNNTAQPPPPRVARARVAGRIRAAQLQAWAAARGREIPPPRLRPAVRAAVARWFALVDDDGSGTLERHELTAALRAARIPADARSVSEMVELMDTDRDGVIGWREFQSFMERGFASGKRLLSGEFVLPSGVALPLGAMISALSRASMVADVVAGGAAREKWARFQGDPSADAAALARAEQEVQSRQLWRDEDAERCMQMGSVGGSGSSGSNGSSSSSGEVLAAAVQRAAAAHWPNGAPPVPRLRLDTLNALAAGVVPAPLATAIATGASPRARTTQAPLLGSADAGALLPASPRYLHARPSARRAPPRALLLCEGAPALNMSPRRG